MPLDERHEAGNCREGAVELWGSKKVTIAMATNESPRDTKLSTPEQTDDELTDEELAEASGGVFQATAALPTAGSLTVKTPGSLDFPDVTQWLDQATKVDPK